MAKGIRTRKKISAEDEELIVESMGRQLETRVLDTLKVNIKCKTPNQKELVKLLRTKDLTICAGYPGSGKTYLACAVALEKLKSDPKIKKIVIVKSVTTVPGEEIGYLKGTMKEKMEPFMYSFMGNFEKIAGKQIIANLQMQNLIEVFPIAYMRGNTLDNSVIIIDEVQNISVKNIRTIMTRLGEDSQMIFLGDEEQIDMKKPEESSLSYLLKKFDVLDEVGTIRLGEEDVVRHPLIKKIEAIFRES